MKKIALVEDEASIAVRVSDMLIAAGFDVTTFADGESALKGLAMTPADLVLLDLGLPGIDGFEVLRRLLLHSQVPVFVLTNRNDEIAATLAIKMGAKDYIRKPFKQFEDVARIEAAVTGNVQTPPISQLSVRECGKLLLDSKRQICKWQGESLELGRAEFALLWTLAEDPIRPRSREELQKATSVASIGDIITELQRKFGDDGKAIKNVRGRGWRLGDGFLDA